MNTEYKDLSRKIKKTEAAIEKEEYDLGLMDSELQFLERRPYESNTYTDLDIINELRMRKDRQENKVFRLKYKLMELNKKINDIDTLFNYKK